MPLRCIAILLLLLGLAAGPPAASAAETRARSVHRAAPATAQEPSSLIERLGAYLAALWSEEGCRIDPYGRCAASPGESEVTATTSGPSGAEAADADEGCAIDPWGCWRNR